jgi:hypothetical protein
VTLNGLTRVVKYRVSTSYESAHPEALVLKKGERLRFERKPTEWPGWIWCTTEDGKSAWVPESWVEISCDFCVLSRDYNSRELSVRPGDMLELMYKESGWVWARNTEGEDGWIPANRIEPEQTVDL